jgi:hypothetical protein
VYAKTKAEHYGGSLLFRARYLEAHWVRVVFQTLVMSVAALLVMTAVAGKVQQWQADTRQHLLVQTESQMVLLDGQRTAAELSGDLTGQMDAAEKQLSLLRQKQQLLVTSSEPEPIADEIAAAEESCARLTQAVETRYREAVAAYLEDEATEALQLFRTVEGYGDTARWQRLCGAHLRSTVARSLSQGRTLTAWVQQLLFLQTAQPDKAEQLPVSLSAMSGVWICKDGQVYTGDGQAGTETPMRCLRAEGDTLYGGFGTESADTVVCRGAALRVERLPEQKNPAAALLKIQQQGGGELLSIQVISENVIAILDGEWAGRYYRLL